MHIHEGYSSSFVLCVCVSVHMCMCVSVCVSVVTIVTRAFVRRSKIGYLHHLYDIINKCNVWILLRLFCSRDITLFAYHSDAGHFLSTEYVSNGSSQAIDYQPVC